MSPNKRNSDNGNNHRERILSAAGRLFWKRGYLGTSGQDIADAAHVNKSNIFYYFKSKANILHEITSKSLLQLIELAKPVANSNLPPEKKLEMMIENHIRWQASHPGTAGIGQMLKRDLPPKLLRDVMNMRDEYEALFRQVIREVIADGQRERESESALDSLFILGFTNSIIQWYKPDGRLPLEEIISRACAFVLNGLKIPQSGRAYQCKR